LFILKSNTFLKVLHNCKVILWYSTITRSLSRRILFWGG